jgi:hypothetical protein
MGHFYLPELESNIAVPQHKAHWYNNDEKILRGISEGIVISEQTKTRGVSSIPDIWARPLLFQSALRDNSKHPLKDKCIQEWRGLLSLLALHKIIPELENFEIISVKLEGDKFSKAMSNLCPDPVQLEKDVLYLWSNILMIRLNGVPLGAFSPTTLVFTGADYHKNLSKITFPFKDEDGYLCPPKTKNEGIDYVGEWLYHLQQKLNYFFNIEGDNKSKAIIENINKLIKDWLVEIREELGIKDNEPIDISNYKVAEERIDDISGTHPFLDTCNIYCEMLRPLVKKDSAFDEKSIFDVLLRSTRSMDIKTIVITEKILSEQATIWENYQTKSLGDNPRDVLLTHFNRPSGETIDRVNIGDQNGRWIRPELFFLSNILVKTNGIGSILNTSEEELNISSKYILPFKKELLEYFSPEDIREKLRPVYIEDGGVVTFSFIIPVGNKEIKIEKKYRNKVVRETDGLILEIEAPIVEIFPEYLGEYWMKYFLFQGMAEEYNVNPILVGNGQNIASRERIFKNDRIEQRMRIFEISGKNAFPEALEINKSTNVPIGVILMDKKERNQGLKNSWKIGIDFGTSNTNVYKKSGSAELAEHWTYSFPDYYRTITLSDPSKRQKLLEEYFFPTREIKLPIPTTLRVFNLAKKDLMVLDYFIFFPMEYKFHDNVITDIKWNDEGERKTEFFFESLLFLIFVEIVKNGVEKVEIACSYPKAFTDANIKIFKREWDTVINKLMNPDKYNPKQILVTHSGSSEDNDTKIKINLPAQFRTEGVAAGEYFASKQTISRIEDIADKEIASICLDAGGGTTDISIWVENEIEYDSSVLLAGRQIAKLLQKNNRVRELLFTKEAAIALDEKKTEPGYFSARLNLILKNEEEHIQEMLIKHANNKDILWLRQIIALEFSALSFFAAQVCVLTDEKIKKDGRIPEHNTLLNRIATEGIKLHWGGNAAKLINWIDFGKYDRDGVAQKLLNGVFYNCLNDKDLGTKSIKPMQLQQLQSPGHKSEASGGLVVMNMDDNPHSQSSNEYAMNDYSMPDENENNEEFNYSMICGENIQLVDRDVRFYEPVTKKTFFDENSRTLFKATSLDRLLRFINIVNFFGLKNGLFTEETKIFLGENDKRIIKDGVRKEFIRMQSLKPDARLIEPIFITEIKLLLEIIESKIK